MFATKYYQDKAFVQDLISCRIVFYLPTVILLIYLFFMQSSPPFLLLDFVHLVSHCPPDSLPVYLAISCPGIQDAQNSLHLPSHLLVSESFCN